MWNPGPLRTMVSASWSELVPVRPRPAPTMVNDMLRVFQPAGRPRGETPARPLRGASLSRRGETCDHEWGAEDLEDRCSTLVRSRLPTNGSWGTSHSHRRPTGTAPVGR